MGTDESQITMRENKLVKSHLLSLVVLVVFLAGCGVPEVDLELPERPRSLQTVPPTSTGPTNSAEGTSQPSSVESTTDPSTSPPDSDELDELEQLVSEIESLLEGVSDELDQITFEEEGG